MWLPHLSVCAELARVKGGDDAIVAGGGFLRSSAGLLAFFTQVGTATRIGQINTQYGAFQVHFGGRGRTTPKCGDY